MNHLILAYWKPAASGFAIPGKRPVDRARFIAGLAISAGGAAVLLADVMHQISSLSYIRP